MEKLLDSEDLINKEHVLLQDLINACYFSGAFKETLKYLSDGIGFGIDLGRFTFWSDLDEHDKTFYEGEFKGIEIELGSESEIIDYEILYYYLTVAAKRCIQKSPQYREEFEKYLENMRINLKIEK
ncbi:hypothetical protein J25TS5_16150 [Paenibacillus faecis]|uniref:ribonuclease toxin immunity protein CdiI n=1 Tax=Paenibacillus faecis TaxID=862114 RepID=UPI001B154C4D|nr:hypothetical protein [Paenibacillus faecis]GIO84683.1 hypothetical protein J25TS5_16150 [Paenibacillus faecis]